MIPDHIISYIWKYSKRQQLTLIALTFASFPLLYFSLEIPKLIINNVLSSKDELRIFFGYSFEPFSLLMLLSFSLLGLVITSGLFKVYINTMKGKLGETLIRRLRYLLMTQLLKFPLQRFEYTPAGEISITIVQETDPLAGFAGESFALPVFQGGTLLTILLFMFMQDWLLGVASLALVPIQIFIIPRIQRQINELRKKRVKRVRVLSSRVVETVEAIEEVHIQGTRRYTLAEFSYRFGELYKIRLSIFKKKFFMKFLNNLMGHMTPFLFYAIGGYLILEGRLTIGALVAAIAAHKDFLNPWKELLNYYQNYQDNVVKYQNIIEQFYPNKSNLLVENTNDQQPETPADSTDIDAIFKQPLTMSDVSFYRDSGELLLQNIDLSIERGQSIAIVAENSDEARAFARVLSGLQPPSQGQVMFGDTPLSSIPESTLRQNMGFVTARPHLFNAALSYNLGYALNHVPPEAEPHQQSELAAAIKAGTSPDWFDESFDCVWIDLPRLGANGWSEVLGWIHEQMSVVNASEQMVNLALHEAFDPAGYPETVFGDFPEKLLSFRDALQQYLKENQYADYVEFFQADTFNYHATLEENLIFGTCLNDSQEVRSILISEIAEKLNKYNILAESFSIAALALKQLMDKHLSAKIDQNTIQKFDLADEQAVTNLQRLAKNMQVTDKNKSNPEELIQVLSFFLKLTPTQWPEIKFSQTYIKAVLDARIKLIEILSNNDILDYHNFDRGAYNPGLSVMYNMLFGKFDETNKEITNTLSTQIKTLIDEAQIEANLIQLMIINSHAGVGGHRIPEPTRYTLNLVRTLMKKPAVLIMHDALLPLGQEQQATILNNIRASRPDITLIWISSEQQHQEFFDQTYQLDQHLETIEILSVTESYPDRPISLLVAYNAGAATDYQARIVTMMAAATTNDNQNKYLSGQPLMVTNHPGEGGRTGWNHFVTQAAVDGYELAAYNIPHVIAQAIVFPDKVEYTLENLEPLANWGADPAVFVVAADSPLQSMADVIKFAGENPGELTLSGAGLYVGHHIAALQLEKAATISVQYVLGTGGNDALKMITSQQVMAGFNNLSDAFRQKDKLRILGIADLQRNTEFLPDVPTLIEQGIDVDDASVNFRGIMAPQGLAAERIDYLSENCCAMFADKKVIEKMQEGGASMRIMPRDEVIAMWGKRRHYLTELLADY